LPHLYSFSIIGLLTCAHVVYFSDTLYSYYDPENKNLKSISIKIKQQNHVGSLEASEPIEIVAINKKQDIALLIKKQFLSTKEHRYLQLKMAYQILN